MGKWHLGLKSPAYLPSHRGFDRFFGYYTGVMDYWTHAAHVTVDPTSGAVVNGGLDLHLGGADFGLGGKLDQPVYNTSGDYSTLMFARKASEWIEEHAQTRPHVPMFLYLPFQGIHRRVGAPRFRTAQFGVWVTFTLRFRTVRLPMPNAHVHNAHALTPRLTSVAGTPCTSVRPAATMSLSKHRRHTSRVCVPSHR